MADWDGVAERGVYKDVHQAEAEAGGVLQAAQVLGERVPLGVPGGERILTRPHPPAGR